MSLPTSRIGLAELERRVVDAGGGQPLIALEQTGALHRAWQAALAERWPGALRVFAPSETQASLRRPARDYPSRSCSAAQYALEDALHCRLLTLSRGGVV
ncbi:MAG: hypothetical protein M3133_11580 [Actinomycetota bacterium]|nr:hypothetical protein [Actinomycetota bacterium]